MNTITAYNKPLYAPFEHKGASTDTKVYEENKFKLDALAPYFEYELYNVWDTFFRYKNPKDPAKKVDKPSLGAFVKYGLMDQMYFHIQGYQDTALSHIEVYLMKHRELLIALVDETDDGWSLNTDFGGGWYMGDNKLDAESYANGKKTMILNRKYYDLIIDEIGEE